MEGWLARVAAPVLMDKGRGLRIPALFFVAFLAFCGYHCRMTALRFNEGKTQVHYILFYRHFIEALAKVQEQGGIKYGYANWAAGGKPDTEYLDAGMRHLLAFFDGEMYDEDTGSMHLAQVCWNFMNLIEQNYKDWPTLDPSFDQEAFIERWKDLPKAGHALNVMERTDNGDSRAGGEQGGVSELLQESLPGLASGD